MIVRTYGRRSRAAMNDTTAAVYEISDDDDELEDPFAFKEDEEPSSSSSSFYNNNFNNKKKNPSFLSQETLEFQESSQEQFNFTFSSQDSTRFDKRGSESSPGASLQLLKPRRRENKKVKRVVDDGRGVNTTSFFAGIVNTTTSLMETQECGEMMECVDEVEFALDGLRQGGKQGVRVRRGSLLALLNVCGSAQQRRLLKAQGIAKTIIDVILDLSLDDSSSNLAAATLFYILTNDESYLLDSSPSIKFLLQLLNPVVAEPAADKGPSISRRLLALRKDMLIPQDLGRKIDSSSTSIVQKVLETLVSCKDLKVSNVDEDDMLRRELNPDWVSLLTMEKACLSTISLEDTTGNVRKTGGNFKEKLRQLGGLDAVFELAINFHSTLEGLIKNVAPSAGESTEGKLQCLPLLLKCLKIMENATFLSKENQSHLLRLKRNRAGQSSSLSFVKLMVNFIKILSELSFRRSSSATSSPETAAVISNGKDHSSDLFSKADQKVLYNNITNQHHSSVSEAPVHAGMRGAGSAQPLFYFEDREVVSALDSGVYSTRFSQECSSSGRYHSESGLSTTQSSQRSSASDSGSKIPNSQSTSRSWLGNSFIDIASSSGSGSCSLTTKRSDNGPDVNGHGIRAIIDSGEGSYGNGNDEDMVVDLEDSQDPFAFDEGDFAPSKWDKPSVGKKGRRKQKRDLSCDVADMHLSHSMLSQDCSSQPMLSQEDHPSQPMLRHEQIDNMVQNESFQLLTDTSCTTSIDEENSNLVADCLLTAIKVLMNLTNDNAMGCQQIAIYGGLETLSLLIARHFPSFTLSLCGGRKENSSLTISAHGQSPGDVHLNDHELDFLVTILGLLVNLVENDSDNRSRLAATKVSLPSSGGWNEVCTGVIPLFCAVFLANRGAGEAAEEEQPSLDDEEVVLQGEKEAEKMIVEAYAALLLAFLSTDSKSIRTSIANYLPDRSLKVLVPVLDRFVTFHLTLNMISPETHKTVSEVIESCRLP